LIYSIKLLDFGNICFKDVPGTCTKKKMLPDHNRQKTSEGHLSAEDGLGIHLHASQLSSDNFNFNTTKLRSTTDVLAWIALKHTLPVIRMSDTMFIQENLITI
jgi:hypothetical protein